MVEKAAPAQLGGLRRLLETAGLDKRPEPMADTGLAHAHFLLPGSGSIARVPEQSRTQLGATESLAYQSAGYSAGAKSGHTPRFDHVLRPTADRRLAARGLIPMRRAMWLWSMTLCAKWRVVSIRAARRDATGEDRAADGSDGDLVDHVRGRVDHHLAPETTRMNEDEFAMLDNLMPLTS